MEDPRIISALFIFLKMAYYNVLINTMPKGRFKFVFTPKHGSWLNMIESFFSKMTRQMLRGIRVNTKQELEERIYKYFDEVNREPVVYHWKYKMDEISEEEAVSI